MKKSCLTSAIKLLKKTIESRLFIKLNFCQIFDETKTLIKSS